MATTQAQSGNTDQSGFRPLHVVRAGETLIGIAKRHGVTLKALLAANAGIDDPSRIRVGQTIVLPAGQVLVRATGILPEATPAVADGGSPMDVSALAAAAPGESAAFAAMDKRGKARSLHPVFRQRLAMLAELLARRGMKALITDGLRTFEEQDKLFQIGRRGVPGEGKVTNARGGMSNHNYGLAVDIYPMLPDATGKDKVFTSIPKSASVEFGRAFTGIQNAVGDEAERLGLFWGARFMGIVDTPHVQLLAQHEMSPRECLQIFRGSGNNLHAVWDEATRRVKPLNS